MPTRWGLKVTLLTMCTEVACGCTCAPAGRETNAAPAVNAMTISAVAEIRARLATVIRRVSVIDARTSGAALADGVECLREIGDEVVGSLDAYGDPHQGGIDREW